MNQLMDHGLPLVQLREQRRDLIVSLQRTRGPISGWQLMQIAALQQVITACEEVLVDFDAETEAETAPLLAEHNVVCLRNL
jgi:hypothetical protein